MRAILHVCIDLQVGGMIRVTRACALACGDRERHGPMAWLLSGGSKMSVPNSLRIGYVVRTL